MKHICILASLLALSLGACNRSAAVDTAAAGAAARTPSQHGMSLELRYASELGINRGEFLTESTLLTGPTGSKFYYTSYPATESMGAVLQRPWGEIQDIIEGDPDGMPIYTDAGSGLIHWRDRPGVYYPFIIDTLGVSTPAWTLVDSARVCGTLGICRLGIAEWAGRRYRAWYLPKYPTSFGPYKFHGLPGAVYSISSEDGRVSFELSTIRELSTAPAGLARPAGSRVVTHAQHRDAAFRQLLETENQGFLETIEPSDPDWLIERNRFMYHDEYLARRKR